MRVNLVVVEGKPLGAVIPLKTDRFVIGRERGCQLRPKSPAVSDRQCAIIRKGPTITVRDLGSASGTLVNDRCLRQGDEVKVSDGDRLQIGQLIFTIQIDTEVRDRSGEGKLQTWLSTPSLGSGFFARPTEATLVPVSGGTKPVVAPEQKTPGGISAAFTYEDYDKEHLVAIFGLSQAQLAEDRDVRVMRKALYDRAAEERSRRMVLDLSELENLPSMAVAMMLALARRCQNRGGELRLCGAPPPVKRLTEALRLGDVIACYDGRSEAVADPWE